MPAARTGPRECPFDECDKRIPDYQFACLSHWRALSPTHKTRIHASYKSYMEGRLTMDELRSVQADVMRSHYALRAKVH